MIPPQPAKPRFSSSEQGRVLMEITIPHPEDPASLRAGKRQVEIENHRELCGESSCRCPKQQGLQ